MTLPVSPTPAITTSPNCLVLYGAPKIGKTSIVSALPRHLLLDLEQGSSYVTATKLVVDNIFAIDGIIDELQKDKNRYSYLIVDTLDALESWCEVEATRQYKDTIQGKNFRGKTVLELPQGGGYLWLRNCFYNYFNRLRLCCDKTIFISHLRDKLLTENGKEVSSKDLDLTGKIRNIVCSYCDAVGRVFVNSEGKLVISFKTAETVTCGARPPHLSGQEFVFNKPATLADWSQIYLELKT